MIITVLAYLTVFGLPVLGVIATIYFWRKIFPTKPVDDSTEDRFSRTLYEFVKGQYSQLGFPFSQVTFDLQLKLFMRRENLDTTSEESSEQAS